MAGLIAMALVFREMHVNRDLCDQKKTHNYVREIKLSLYFKEWLTASQ